MVSARCVQSDTLPPIPCYFKLRLLLVIRFFLIPAAFPNYNTGACAAKRLSTMLLHLHTLIALDQGTRTNTPQIPEAVSTSS